MKENGDVLNATAMSRANQVRQDYCAFCGGVVAKGASDRLAFTRVDNSTGYIHALCFVNAMKRYIDVSLVNHENSLARLKAQALEMIANQADVLAIKVIATQYTKLIDMKYPNGYRIEVKDVHADLSPLIRLSNVGRNKETLESILASCEILVYKKIEVLIKAGEPIWSEAIEKHLSLLSVVFDICTVKLKMPLRMFDVQKRITVPELVRQKLPFLN